MESRQTEKIVRKSPRVVDVGMPELYWFYHHVEGNTKVDSKTFSLIIKEFYEDAGKRVVSGKNFNMPCRYGVIRAVGRVPGTTYTRGRHIRKAKRAANYRATSELWASDPVAKEERRIVYYDNHHVGGKVYKIRWEERKRTVHALQYYVFKASRRINRTLAQRLISGTWTISE